MALGEHGAQHGAADQGVEQVLVLILEEFAERLLKHLEAADGVFSGGVVNLLGRELLVEKGVEGGLFGVAELAGAMVIPRARSKVRRFNACETRSISLPVGTV